MPSFLASNFTRFCFTLALGYVLLVPPQAAAQPTLFVGEGSDGKHDIFLRDGEAVTQLTNASGHDDDFEQSPDGQCIAFTSDRDGPARIYLMDADGSNQRPLSPANSSDEWYPTFSSDGTRIAFVRREEDGESSIWTMNKDGSDRMRLTPSGPFRYTRPRWKPMDKDVIFRCDFLDDDDLKLESGRSQSVGHTTDVILWDDSMGFNRFLLSNPTADNYDAEWSPDGSKISLTLDTVEGTVILVTNAAGGNPTQVTAGPLDSNSAWLGNDKVLYESRADGNAEVYSANASGGGLTNLTNNPAEDRNPAGTHAEAAALLPAVFRGGKAQAAPQVLFISDRMGNDDIFVMNADGTGQTTVASMPGNESDAQFYITPPAAGGPEIAAGGVVMANLLPTVGQVSPLSIISVFGQNFATGTILYPTLDGDGDLDRILGGTCLEMNGERLPIFAVTPGQINAQASGAQTLGPASFTVITDCDTPNALRSETARGLSPASQALTSGVEMATVEEATPVFFIFNPVAADGFIAARFNDDNVAVAPDGVLSDQFGPSRLAKPGDIVVLYGTGWGQTEAGLAAGELATAAAEVLPAANPTVTFGGVVMDPADVFYVGVTPQAAGLYQLAIRIPEGAQAGNNQVVLTVYGKSTPVGPVIPVMTP